VHFFFSFVIGKYLLKFKQSNMRYADFITKDYPILISKTYPIEPTVADLDEYFNAIDVYLETTSGPYVFISYSEGEAKFLSAEARIHIGKKAEYLSEKYKERNKASIIVTKGIMANMMLKAISIVYKPLKDSTIVTTLEEALEKAKEILNIKS
jgi:hypothetical protein